MHVKRMLFGIVTPSPSPANTLKRPSSYTLSLSFSSFFVAGRSLPMLADGREGRKPITKRGPELLTIKFAHTGFPPTRKKISMMFVNLFCFFTHTKRDILTFYNYNKQKHVPSKEERSTRQQLGQKSRAGPKHH
jgi:hypothetical protein